MSQAVLSLKMTKTNPVESVPNSHFEILTQYTIRWFKCKLKLPKKGKLFGDGTAVQMANQKLTPIPIHCFSLPTTTDCISMLEWPIVKFSI